MLNLFIIIACLPFEKSVDWNKSVETGGIISIAYDTLITWQIPDCPDQKEGVF
ncbi:hypothetical protein [Nitrosomonas sp.]|uniref:hypothetical protein n=1 Tax=Nitrosomonas sp. TaxID=42353 RepID=UPI003305D224